MRIEVNGDRREVAGPMTVADLLDAMSLPANGIAVAVDGAVVPRADHAHAELADGSVVEILTAVQGG